MPLSDDLLPLLRLRGKSAEVVHAEQTWQPGDSIIFLTRAPLEQAQEYLAGLK